MDPASELRRADALHLERRFHEAVEAYRHALAGDLSLHEAWYGLGCASLTLKAYADAADALRRAVVLRPDADGARSNLAEALFQLGEVDAAVAEYHRAADSGNAELRAIVLAGIACIAPGATHQDNSNVMAARQRWIDWQARDVRRVTAAPPEAGRKPRVGYLGAFFGARNWMKMYMGVINAHDRDRFEFHFFSDGGAPSAACGYTDHAEDRIWEIGGVPNADLARHIAEAGIDVLVDLNGYSFQRRLPLFLYRPARLQICWNGMYGTTGLPDLDWLVGDAAVIPPEEERYYREQIVRVPGSYLAFWVFYPVPDVAPPPCMRVGHLTFGCFASAYKLTEQTIAAYARILRDAPASRLLLRNRTLDEMCNRAALLGRFARYGVTADRLTLEGGAEHFDFLRSYDRVDVALDTFPYNGGTTTAEALWQGVPMLTCNGDRWAGRTSRSLLLAGGLSEWVAADLPGFQDAAVALASAPDTPGRLAALRGGMRDRLRASAACDVVTLCRSLEALYASPVRSAGEAETP
ncbi:MAG TPA: tetratricopeptide repeat protein [Acetobacteraceae bacterium]